MNQFNKIAQQCQELWAGMNSQAKLLSALLFAAILLSAGMLISTQGNTTSGQTYLFDGEKFSDEQLAQMELALSNSNLSDFHRSQGRLQIPSDKKSEYYRAIANANAAPSSLSARLLKELNQSNIFEATKTSEAKQLLLKQQGISEELQRIPYVQQAFVTFDSQRAGLSYTQQKTAQISITPKAGKSLNRQQSQYIIRWVCGAFSGLKPSDVSLLDTSTGQTYSGESDPLALEADRYYQLKRQQEDDLRARAEMLLAEYGNVRLEVNVELDNTSSEETSKLNYDAKPTTVQTNVTRKDTDNQKNTTGGRPGTEPNALANRSASISQTPDQINKSKEQTESTRQVAGNTVAITKKTGWQTKDVAVSVLVPFSYYRRAFQGEWLQLNPGRTASDMPEFDEAALNTVRQKVEQDIKNILSTIVQTSVPGEDKLTKITVAHFVDLPEANTVEEPAFSAQAIAWLQSSWQTLFLGLIAIVAIFSMRSFAKAPVTSSDKAFENGFDIPLDDALDIQLTGLDDEGLEALNKKQTTEDEERVAPRFRVTGPDLKTELTAMVRDNPDAAATLLRNWIGGAQS